MNRQAALKRRSPPRTKLIGGIRRVQRRSILANSNQVDILQKVRLLLHKPTGVPSDHEAVEDEMKASSRLRVAVRVRPLSSHELRANSREVVAVAGPQMLVFDPPVDHQDFFFHNKKQKDITAKKYKDQKFAFDHVYDNAITNVKIYEDVISPLLSTLMTGVNCSVFAYGATGSGKTFTMLGTPHNPGLTYLAMNDLYHRLQGVSEQFEFQIVVSYFEVYNEQVRDLLNYTGEQLQVREIGTGIDIGNLSYHHPRDVNHLMEMLRTGNSHRSQHPTDHNAESSRSHALLQVQIQLRERHSNMNTTSRSAKLVMVDLAGSEKGTATGYKGQRFREGSSINKSLLALGNCISALASGKKFIQFRDSKLTRILKDSLGGNCKTVMVANVSPAESLYDDTLNTLRYAEKAKKISCKAKKNVMTVQSCLSQYTRVVDEMAEKIGTLESESREKDALISQLREELEWQKNDTSLVRTQLEELQGKFYQQQGLAVTMQGVTQPGASSAANIQLPTPVAPTSSRSPHDIGPMKAFFHVVKVESVQKSRIRKSVENCLYDLELSSKRLTRYEKMYQLTGDRRFEKAGRKVRRKMGILLKKLDHTLNQMTNLLASVEKTAYTQKPSSKYPSYPEMWSNMKQTLQPGQVPKVLLMPPEDALTSLLKQKRGEELAAENGVIKSQLANLMTRCDEKDELLSDAVNLTNRLHNIVKHYGHDTPTLTDQYENFISSFCGTSVHFADGGEEDLEDERISEPTSQESLDVGNELLCENPAQFFQSTINRIASMWRGSDEASTTQFNEILKAHQEKANMLLSCDFETAMSSPNGMATLPYASLPSTSNQMDMNGSEAGMGTFKNPEMLVLTNSVSSTTAAMSEHQRMEERFSANAASFSSEFSSVEEERAVAHALEDFRNLSGHPPQGSLNPDIGFPGADDVIRRFAESMDDLPPLGDTFNENPDLPPEVEHAIRSPPSQLLLHQQFSAPYLNFNPVPHPSFLMPPQPLIFSLQPGPSHMNFSDPPIPPTFMMPSQRLNRMEEDQIVDTYSIPEDVEPAENLNVTTTVSRFDGTFVMHADEDSRENQSPENRIAEKEAVPRDRTMIIASEENTGSGGARKRTVEGDQGQTKAAKYAKKTPYAQNKRMSPKVLKVVKKPDTKVRSQPIPLKFSAKLATSSASRLPKKSPSATGLKKPKLTPTSSSVGGNLPLIVSPIEGVPPGPGGDVCPIREEDEN